jgi:dihydrofolate synthase/folylpolyglutamate synthase
MTYQETLDFMFQQLPMYQREGKSAFKKDLTNIKSICKILGNPQDQIKTLHIAGTNGKGSTAHMLSSVFQEAGYKTGLYTSPHLKDFRERVKINGQMISENEVIKFVDEQFENFKKISPSFFEWTVALAFSYFSKEKVDVAIIETGLGGRLDSTNIINPILSIITNIGLDHIDMLGNTLDKIAFEKAGIIKDNIPIVVGNHNNQKQVFKQKAQECNAPIIYANELNLLGFESDLKGNYQKENINTVAYSIIELKKQGWRFSEYQIKEGFKNSIKNTGLKGRWQIVQENPKIIFETAHNKDGFEIVVNQLNSESFNKLHLVLGFVKDKSIEDLLVLLPKDAKYYFCQATIPRSLDVKLLYKKAIKFQLKGNVYSSVSEAYGASIKSATKEDLIYVGGSNFVVAEVL